MLTGDFNHFHQQFFAVDRAGRVIWVDDHNAAGARGDFTANIVEVREPALLFVAEVMHRFTARQRNRSGPERIVRRRNQHFIAHVQQRLHRLDNQL